MKSELVCSILVADVVVKNVEKKRRIVQNVQAESTGVRACLSRRISELIFGIEKIELCILDDD